MTKPCGCTKSEWETYLKNRFLEEKNKAYYDLGHDPEVYTPGMIRALVDMAKENVYPDWRFGDTDCNVWEMFR